MSVMRFGVKTDLVVVGHNPELADVSNPRGEMVGLGHYIVAECSDGRRFAHSACCYTIGGGDEIVAANYDDNPVDDYEDYHYDSFSVDSGTVTVTGLEDLANYLNTKQPKLNPMRWTEIQACYGSNAYVRDNWEDIAIEREREDARWEAYR